MVEREGSVDALTLVVEVRVELPESLLMEVLERLAPMVKTEPGQQESEKVVEEVPVE
jgi:hypothetical protein